MTRKEILEMPEYWIANIQVSLYDCAARFMQENEMNRTQLAEYLGVSKGYVSQLLNGDYDHKISKLVDLALKFGFVPKIEFKKFQDYVLEDSISQINSWKERKYFSTPILSTIEMGSNAEYTPAPDVELEIAA